MQGVEKLNQSKLDQEGKKWVEEGIISEKQLKEIIQRYPKKDANIVIILFAVLLIGLGFITFIMSDWAQAPHFSRLILLCLATVGLYVLGDVLYRKQSAFLGVSFITLGYIVFGSGLLLAITIYQVQLYAAWPFMIWSVVGLLLYYIYEHNLLFTTSIIVLTAGQIYSGISFSTFSIILFLLLLFGFAHFMYHRANRLFGYLFGISFSIQMVVLVSATSQQYYWLVVYYLTFYLISELLSKQILQSTLKYTSLISIFIFGMYQTFLLQEDYVMKDIEYQWSFLVVWLIATLLLITLKYKWKKLYELPDLILFLPIVFLPYAYVLSLIVLYVFSLLWLYVGFQKKLQEKVLLGTIAFLFSTFTVYIQFAWDALNKSLFFFIGGILLFVISFVIEKQRRRTIGSIKGER